MAHLYLWATGDHCSCFSQHTNFHLNIFNTTQLLSALSITIAPVIYLHPEWQQDPQRIIPHLILQRHKQLNCTYCLWVICGMPHIKTLKYVILHAISGWGLNPGGRKLFCTRLQQPWGPSSHLYNGYRVIPGVQRPGWGADRPPPYSAEVKEGVELYLYSGPSWTVLGWTSFFTCHLDGKYWNYSPIVHSIYNNLVDAKKVNTLLILFKNNRNLMNGIKVN